MFKCLLLNLTLINLFGLSAMENQMENQQDIRRGPVVGTIYPNGITFATKEDEKEAINRGVKDLHIVGKVCELIHPTQNADESYSSTITEVYPGIFMGCKHAVDKLLECIQYFSEQKQLNYQFELGIISGDIAHSIGIDSMKVALNQENDLALLKLEIQKSSKVPPKCDFLPFATSIENSGNGFVVSCCNVSVVNNKPLAFHKRALCGFMLNETNLRSRIRWF